jgi:flagellar hook assembly protein FlgD
LRSLLLAVAVAAALVTGTLPGIAPTAVSAATAPKVAIIVGPVGGSTAGYKRDADAAAAEALKYTPNVVKVYTPFATWDAAKAAMQGASIVIYMGHGNGFPSPHTSTLAPDRQNGLGVNPTAGVNDTATKYYGEDFLRNEVRLAPNAIVLLGHLCYASGSSEPGRSDPTRDQAMQRVDNFAAGFLAAGARAVIAEAYNTITASYVAALFTTNQSVFDMWLTSRTSQGAAFAFPSVRSAGMTAQMDPDRSSGKFYRAIVGDPTLTTNLVIGSGSAPLTPAAPIDPTAPVDPTLPAPTLPADPSLPAVPTVPIAPVDPNQPAQPTPTPTSTPTPTPAATPPAPAQPQPVTAAARFSVPGAAAVAVNGAPVYVEAALTVDALTSGVAASLPLDAPVRILSAAGTAPDGSAIYGVAALKGTLTGYMTASTLRPADSLAPVLLSVSAPTAFSPNGDGILDTITLSATLSEPSDWELAILAPGGAPVATQRGSGSTAAASWNGTSGGARVADGTYTWRVTATDAWGNGPAVRSGAVAVDTTPPVLTTTLSKTAPVTFSPNGDGVNDMWAAKLELGGPGSVEATVTSADGSLIRRLSATSAVSAATLTWDGRADGGRGVADGNYTITVTGRDAAGNVGPAAAFPIVVYRALGAVTASTTTFYPQDRDVLARSTRLGFTLVHGATVTWQIVDAAGRAVLTKYDAVAFGPRSVSMVWTGLDQAGAPVPPGRYTAVLSITNGTLTDTVRTSIVANAFALTSSVATVRRGGSVTITAFSAEPLKAAPKLSYTRPGLAAQTYSMTKVAPNTYRLTIRLSNNGTAGTMAFKVVGVDARGGSNVSALRLPLR